MTDFLLIMKTTLEFMKIPINVYGFVFTPWDIVLVSLLFGVVVKLVVGIFDL